MHVGSGGVRKRTNVPENQRRNSDRREIDQPVCASRTDRLLLMARRRRDPVTGIRRKLERDGSRIPRSVGDETVSWHPLRRAVVAAATAAILDSGRIARYFAFSDNIPSLRICRSLGFRQDHAVRYFWAQRRP